MAYLTADEFVAYIQVQDIEQLSDDVTGSAVAPEVVEPILDSASSICDSYIGVKYTVPLTSPDYAVKDACSKIAAYYLHLRRAWTVSDAVKAAYDAALDWLKDVAMGKAVLPIPPASVSSTSGYFGAEERIFQGVSHDNTTDKFNGF